MDKKKRGRPESSHNVRVTPEFRETPDIEKLGRALIAIAISNAEKNNSGKRTDIDQTKSQTLDIRKGGDMT